MAAVFHFGQQRSASPLTEWPVMEIVSDMRIVADLTLDLGRVLTTILREPRY
jgi:acetoacetate decarboxylase